MQDYAIRATAYDGQVRAFAARTTELARTLQRRHQTWPIASAALGRTATIGAMMGMMLKQKSDKLTIQVQGDGPLGQIVVTANPQGEIRGYVQHPHVHMEQNKQGKLNVGGAVGRGRLNVVQDLGLKEPYRGNVELISGELGEDFAYYFSVSEQTPSAVAAGVLVEPDNTVSHAGGLIVQMLPDAAEDVVEKAEKGVQRIVSVTDLLVAGATPEDLLQRALGESVRIHDEVLPLTFRCHCSRERIENMLRALGREEIESLIEEQGVARVECHFCNETYILTAEQLQQLFK